MPNVWKQLFAVAWKNFFLLFIHLSLAYLFQIIDQIIILDKDDLNKYKRFFNNLIY